MSWRRGRCPTVPAAAGSPARAPPSAHLPTSATSPADGTALSLDPQAEPTTATEQLRRAARGGWWLPLGAVALLLLAWWAVTASGVVAPLFLPTPGSVVEAFTSTLLGDYRGASLLEHLAISLARVLGSLLVALLTAIPLAVVVGRAPRLARLVEPFVDFYRVLPPLAYYTLLVIWLGIGEGSKVALLILAGFPPLFIGTVAGVRGISEDRLAAAATLDASGWRLYRYVIGPSALPDIFTAVRVAAGFTYTTLVAAEIVAAESGIGWMVLDASRFLRTDVVWMGILVMGVTGLLLDAGIRALQRRFVPWHGRA